MATVKTNDNRKVDVHVLLLTAGKDSQDVAAMFDGHKVETFNIVECVEVATRSGELHRLTTGDVLRIRVAAE